MKKIVLLIITCLPLFYFSQKDSVKNLTTEKRLVYLPFRNLDLPLKHYSRNVYVTPLPVSDLRRNPTGKNRISIHEEKIGYIQNIHSHKGSVFFYDTIAVHKTTLDPLNGLYQIKTKNKRFDTVVGVFKNGSPFLSGDHNIFSYYASGMLLKKRFFVLAENADDYRLPVKVYTEDYSSIKPDQWKREIRLWPSEMLLAEDTVFYSHGKTYLQGWQNMYNYDRIDNRERYINKTHFFSKGNLKKTTFYKYDFNSIEIVSSDLTDKNYRTTTESKDYQGNVYKRNTFINYPQKNCHPDLPIPYYTGTNGAERCFVFDGYQYEYRGSENRNHPDDIEQIFYYDKGILIRMETKNGYQKEVLSDNLTIHVYGKPIAARVNETIRYKDRKIIKEYFSGESKKPVLKITRKYEGCISHPLFESYPCNSNADQNTEKRFTNFIEYYDDSGNIIFKKLYDSSFSGSFEEDINTQFGKDGKPLQGF